MIKILKDIIGAIDANAIKISGSKDSMTWFDEWLHNARKASSDSDFKAGLKEGLRMFAWWKDGTQYVGTCGGILKDVLAEVDDGKFDFILKEK